MVSEFNSIPQSFAATSLALDDSGHRISVDSNLTDSNFLADGKLTGHHDRCAVPADVKCAAFVKEFSPTFACASNPNG